ncbi:MAG: glycosyltransferase [Oscillospiraceae bacterium]|nr:glycosyltransferase [Oscillospiraceae bacterium]
MKARIIDNIPKITLSVGMIVKNEHKYLNDCLTALKPLLDGISSELIIVDTGSTDDTVEIAERFTDNVFHFDWINDFAAARNFGLEKCSGEWFMFLDADDIFNEDLSEMLNFFKDRTISKNYNSATYYTKDYTNVEKNDYAMFARSRIVRRRPDIKFVNPIHEYIEGFYAPVCNFSTYANHYGYVYETAESKAKKKERNLSILEEELRKNPDDLRAMMHILNEEPDSAEQHEQRTAKAIETAKKVKNQYSAPCYLNVILYYFNIKNYNQALNLIKEYFSLFKAKDVLLLDLYVCLALIYLEQGKEEEAIKAFTDYFQHYMLYINNKLDKTPMLITPITHLHPENYQKVKAKYNEFLSKTGRMKIKFDAGNTSPVKIKVVQKEEQ